MGMESGEWTKYVAVLLQTGFDYELDGGRYRESQERLQKDP